MSRHPIQPTWAAAAVLAIVAGLVGTWVSVGPGRLGLGLFHLLTGWILAGSGLATWRILPSSRVGPLLAAAGVAFFVGDLADCLDLRPLHRPCVRVPLVSAAASGLEYLWTGFVAHALLTWPAGRVTSRTNAIAVAMGYGAALLPGLWQTEAGSVVLSAAIAFATAVRWRRAGSHVREERLPAAIAAAFVAGSVASAWIVTWVRSGLTDGDPFLASLGAGLRNVTPQGVLPIAWALAGLGLAATLAARAGEAQRVADRVVDLGRVPDEPIDDLVASVLGADVGAGTGLEALLQDPLVTEAVGRAAALLREHDVLRVEAQAQLAEVLTSRRRLADAAVEERRALEARLHGGAERELEALGLELDGIAVAGGGAVAPEAAERIARAAEQLAETRREVRELAQGLHPRVLDALGLAGALADLAGRSPIPVALRIREPVAPSRSAGVTAWFVINEALANGIKHARAKTMDVEVEAAGSDGLRISIADDGVGGAVIVAGGGLDGLRDRVEALGGHLVVDSTDGAGTRLVATIPGDEARGPRG